MTTEPGELQGPSGEPVENINATATPPTNSPVFMTYTPSDSSWLSTNTAGNQIGYVRYDAYGSLAEGTPSTAFGYAGQYSDLTTTNATGLDNMRARWYQPTTGNFTTIDPDLSNTNQYYNYASDDPVDLTDPTGLCFGGVFCGLQHDIGGIGSDIGGAAGTAFRVLESAALSALSDQVSGNIAKLKSYATSPNAIGPASDCASYQPDGGVLLEPPTPSLGFEIAAAIVDASRLPDYVAIEGAGSYVGGALGGVVTFTRYGDVFLGPEEGISLSGISGTLEFGWIDQQAAPPSDQVSQFVRGLSISAGGYVPYPFDRAGAAGAEVYGDVGDGGFSALSTQVGVGFGFDRNLGLYDSESFQISSFGPVW